MIYVVRNIKIVVFDTGDVKAILKICRIRKVALLLNRKLLLLIFLWKNAHLLADVQLLGELPYRYTMCTFGIGKCKHYKK